MNIKSNLKPISNIRITVRDLEGKITERVTLKNTITNLLFNLYRDALAGDWGNILDAKIKHIAIGDDDGTALPLAVTNVALGNEVFRVALTDEDVSVTAQYTTVFYLAPDEAVGTIEELGWYAGTASIDWGGGAGKDTGTLIARVFWTHTKTIVESIQFERVDSISEA